MKLEHKKELNAFLDKAEKFLMEQVALSGFELGFALHANIQDGPGGMISNIPHHQQIEYAEYCKRNVKASLEKLN